MGEGGGGGGGEREISIPAIIRENMHACMYMHLQAQILVKDMHGHIPVPNGALCAQAHFTRTRI